MRHDRPLRLQNWPVYLPTRSCSALLHIMLIGTLSLYALPGKADNTSSQAHSDRPTTVYKSINPDGSVSFSDQPVERAETLLIQPVPTVPAYKPETVQKIGTTSAITQTQTQKDIIPYNNFSFLSPVDQSAFNSGSGDVNVVLALSPALLANHLLELQLDNKVVFKGNDLHTIIPNVDRGSHVLSARIIATDGSTLIESRSRFTVHRPSIKR